MQSPDEDANTAGIVVVLFFLVVVWVLRALFAAADQSK